MPYDQWIREGHLSTIPGAVIRYDVIERELLALSRDYTIREIAIDPYGALNLMNQLLDHGFTVVQMQQSFAILSPPTKELLRLVAGSEIEHGGDPVLKWMAANVALQQNAVGDIRPSKKKSKGRIDGIVALVMAIDRASRHGMIPRSIYEDRHLYDQQLRAEGEDPDATPDSLTKQPSLSGLSSATALPQSAPLTPTADPTQPARTRARRSIYDSEEWTALGEEYTR